MSGGFKPIEWADLPNLTPWDHANRWSEISAVLAAGPPRTEPDGPDEPEEEEYDEERDDDSPVADWKTLTAEEYLANKVEIDRFLAAGGQPG